MPTTCLSCHHVFVEDSRSGSRSCPLCHSSSLESNDQKRLDLIDRTLMPYTWSQNPIDPREHTFYKLSTFTDRLLQTELQVMHVPRQDGHPEEGCQLLISPTPIKPYFFIDKDSYQKHTNDIDTVLRRFGGTLKETDFVGSDRIPLYRNGFNELYQIDFDNDTNRKSCTFRLESLCKTYESNQPIIAKILRNYELQVKSYPTRLFWDSEISPLGPPSLLMHTTGRVLTICSSSSDGIQKSYLLPEDSDPAEKELLLSFFEDAFNYPCSSGFYSTKFDVPYSQIRAMRLGINWDWDFLSVMDMHNIYTVQNVFSWDETKFNLESVAQREFGEGKEEISDYQEIQDMWEAKDPRLVSYCMKDADLIRRLDDKIKGIDSRLVATNLTYTRPDTYTGYMQGIEAIVCKMMVNKKNSKFKHPIALYTPNRKQFDVSIEGALVFEPISGVYDNVVFLDFKSMYNRIIRAFNLGFDSLDPEGEIITPFARFTNKEDSVMRDMLTLLEEKRNYYVKERQKYQPFTPESEFYDKRQWQIKYYQVATYGIQASSHSFIYRPDVAQSVTWLGQQNILFARQIIEALGHQTIYGDTDSVAFCVKGQKTPQELLTIGEQIVKYVVFGINYAASTRFNADKPDFGIEVDKIYQPFYLGRAKKKYTGKLVYWRGVFLEQPKLSTVGYESIRQDWPPFIQDFQKELFESKFSRMSDDDLFHMYETTKAKLYSGDFNKEIMQRRAVRRKLSEYAAVRSKNGHKPPAHVRAALDYQKFTKKEIRLAQVVFYYLYRAGESEEIIACDESGKILDPSLPSIPNAVYGYSVEQLNNIMERLDISVDSIQSNNAKEEWA